MKSKKVRNSKKTKSDLVLRKNPFTKKKVIAIIVLSIVFFLVINTKTIIDVIVGNIEFWDAFFTELKDVGYSVGFSGIVFLVLNYTSIANKNHK